MAIHAKDGPLTMHSVSPGISGPASRTAIDLAHDFRVAINIVIGFSALLLQETPGRLNLQQRQDITDIQHSGYRLLKLVDATFGRPGKRKDGPV